MVKPLKRVRGQKSLSKLKLSPVKSAGVQIYEFMREQIVEGSIEPGTVFSENDLAMHFNVSRQPVRDALAKLAQCGLMEIKPQAGSYVKKISSTNLKEICFIRAAIECNALYIGMQLPPGIFSKITARLQHNVEKQRVSYKAPGVNARFLRLDNDFHKTICDLSRTKIAWETIHNVNANLDRIRYLASGTITPIEKLIDEHEQLVELIINKDLAAASNLLRHHLYEVMHSYVPIKRRNAQWFRSDRED